MWGVWGLAGLSVASRETDHLNEFGTCYFLSVFSTVGLQAKNIGVNDNCLRSQSDVWGSKWWFGFVMQWRRVLNCKKTLCWDPQWSWSSRAERRKMWKSPTGDGVSNVHGMPWPRARGAGLAAGEWGLPCSLSLFYCFLIPWLQLKSFIAARVMIFLHTLYNKAKI